MPRILGVDPAHRQADAYLVALHYGIGPTLR